MPLAALVCAGLLGWGDAPPAAPDVAAEYQQARAILGRTSPDQVRLALWCEAHGLTTERARHLALAVLADPDNAAARGLLGLVARDGRWASPDAIAGATRADDAARALLAEYDARRARTPYTADAQWALGQWADEHGLPQQARAHFTAVTRLDPVRDVAWKRLGYKKHDGRWATDDQVAAARVEADAQHQADQRWKPLLEKYRGMLAKPDRREEARVALLAITDPRAVPAIARAFGTDRPADQQVAVGLYGQIEGGAASLALADLAVRGQTPEVRRAAQETLIRRDPRDFVGALVRLVRTPWKYEVRPVAGPGSVGELFVEGERYNVRKLYNPPPLSPIYLPQRLFGANVPLGSVLVPPENLLGLAILGEASFLNGMSGQGFGAGGRSGLDIGLAQASVIAARRDAQILQIQQINQDDARRAQQVLDANVRAIEADNAAIRATNERVLPVLAKVTGLDFGEDHRAWARWDVENAGYAIQNSTDDKPTFTELAPVQYQLPWIEQRHGACFAAGTTVRTVDGTKPIETVERGDLVLVQDTVAGGLSYQPVLTAFHNPPSATYRVKLGEDEVVATGIHRFWRAGHGWAMVRDLKAGDSLRVLGGVATVAAVEVEKVQPVFNLEVAAGRSFFVGRLGALVHDNSLVEATPSPFDADHVAATVADPR